MTPYPARVDRETIINTAHEMIEAEGLEQVSLNKLAKTLGIKAPSLYHHVKNKTDLLRGVNELTLHAMMQKVFAAEGDDLHARLLAIAEAYRDYALAHPVTYTLLYANQPDIIPDESTVVEAMLPLQNVFAALVGPDRALSSLRGLWALMHGFVALELAGHFNNGEIVESSWLVALEAYLVGWETRK